MVRNHLPYIQTNLYKLEKFFEKLLIGKIWLGIGLEKNILLIFHLLFYCAIGISFKNMHVLYIYVWKY